MALKTVVIRSFSREIADTIRILYFCNFFVAESYFKKIIYIWEMVRNSF